MVEIESEGDMTRSDVAAFLREFADELDGGGIGRPQDERPPESTAGQQTDPHRDVGDPGGHEPRRITLIVGGESATVTVPETVEFDIEVESRSPLFRSGVDQEIEFELSWEIEDPDEIREDWLEVE